MGSASEEAALHVLPHVTIASRTDLSDNFIQVVAVYAKVDF
jgi:hypothetical protein